MPTVILVATWYIRAAKRISRSQPRFEYVKRAQHLWYTGLEQNFYATPWLYVAVGFALATFAISQQWVVLPLLGVLVLYRFGREESKQLPSEK